MAAPIKRPWNEYPRSYFYEAQRIARLAVPTLKESFDNPPLCGPYKGRRDTNTFRAQWHRFLEALRRDITGAASQHARLYYILEELTTRSDPRLRANGSEEWWLEFAPHPIILSAWRNEPSIFAGAQQRHKMFINSLDATNNDH